MAGVALQRWLHCRPWRNNNSQHFVHRHRRTRHCPMVHSLGPSRMRQRQTQRLERQCTLLHTRPQPAGHRSNHNRHRPFHHTFAQPGKQRYHNYIVVYTSLGRSICFEREISRTTECDKQNHHPNTHRPPDSRHLHCPHQHHQRYSI